jgi:hypothetical protein
MRVQKTILASSFIFLAGSMLFPAQSSVNLNGSKAVSKAKIETADGMPLPLPPKGSLVTDGMPLPLPPKGSGSVLVVDGMP